MAVLRERVEWRRPKLAHTFALSATEQANVKRALRVIKRRFKRWHEFADALGCYRPTLVMAAGNGRSHQSAPSIALAVRAAQVAGVHVEDVLSGAWPGKRQPCPTCGHL